MSKIFNVTGNCKPEIHYMIDINERLIKIKKMVDRGDYFTINRARQYGKTTILRALYRFLENDYLVISMDFQKEMSDAKFRNENTFSVAFANAFLRKIGDSKSVLTEKTRAAIDELHATVRDNRADLDLVELFQYLSSVCGYSEKPLVLMIDEADSATNNQVFLDFLAQLRGYYIDRDESPTFQSVILAGVYDIKNIKRKIQPTDGEKLNSPWNIAVDFTIDMSFSAKEIAGMLGEYESDHETGMDISEMAGLIYDYTSGYPFLVSRICKLIDERVAGDENFPDRGSAWTKAGFLEAVKILLSEKNTLFESLVNKLTDYPELRVMLYNLLFTGKGIPYSPMAKSIEAAEMFGFIKNENENAVISNRIFETLLYNLFLSEEVLDSKVYDAGQQDKNQFIRNGHLNMELVLEKFVIELKVWRGNAYNTRGEEQLMDYLDYYHLKKGYMISFNFNKKKKIGVNEILLGNKLLVEAVV